MKSLHATVLLFGVSIGCGSIVAPVDGDVTSGADANFYDTRPDIAPPDVLARDASADVAADSMGVGVIEIYQDDSSTTGNAGFYSVSMPSGYSARTVGPCRLEEHGASNVAYQHAGTVSVTSPLGPIDWFWDSRLYDLNQPRALWSTGDTLQLTASGDAVPAFAMQFTSPPSITVTDPQPPDGGFLYVDTSHDLTVAWTGSPPRVAVEMQYDGPGGAMRCSFVGSAGSGVIPAAVLSMLAGRTGDRLEIYAADEQRVDVSTWQFLGFLNRVSFETQIILR